MSQEPTPTTDRARTVLFLDDDELLRNTVRRVLELYGYEVLEAAHAHGALEVVNAHQGPIDLILCDLVLPGLSGREAASALLARRPETKILYTSGYSSAGSFRGELEKSGMNFLPKPFEVQELLDAVERALK